MLPIYYFIILLVSLIILVKGSGIFVTAASKLSRLLGISEFIIGLTVVAIGTSLPELANSITGALTKNTGLLIGNIIGANILNMTLLIGVGSVILAIETKKEMFSKEGLFLFAVTILLLITSLDKEITWTEGLIFLFLFLIYLYTLFKEKLKNKAYITRIVNFVFSPDLSNKSSKKFQNKNKIPKKLKTQPFKTFKLIKQLFLLIIGALLVFLGAKYTIFSASSIATLYNIQQTIVGLTILAIGTTAPELAVTISAARKHLPNLLVGNVIGSSITNILLILGISSIITPLAISNLTLYYTIPFMILSTILLLRFIRSYWLIRTFEAIILIFFYLVFLFGLIFFALFL